MRTLKRLAVILLFVGLLGQSSEAQNYGTGLPLTCVVGAHFYLTSGTIGLYRCTAVDTWTFSVGAAATWLDANAEGTRVGASLSSTCNVGQLFTQTGIGLFYCSATNIWTSMPSSSGVPAGLLAVKLTDGACPAGWTESSALNGKMLFGTLDVNNDAGTTGGSDTLTPAGTVTWPVGVPANSGGAVNAHSGTAVADHASHTHTYTDVVNHVHVYTSQTATTGGVSSYEHGVIDTSSTAAEASISTNNPTGGVATGTTVGPSATLTHAVTQPSAHTFTQPTVAWPAGVPAFAGISGENRSAFTRAIFCQKD